MNTPMAYVLLSEEMLDAIAQTWERWGQEHSANGAANGTKPWPTDIFSVSAVGFDKGKRRALVSLNHFCGLECGDGRHWLLERRDGQWVSFPTEIEYSWVPD